MTNSALRFHRTWSPSHARPWLNSRTSYLFVLREDKSHRSTKGPKAGGGEHSERNGREAEAEFARSKHGEAGFGARHNFRTVSVRTSNPCLRSRSIQPPLL